MASLGDYFGAHSGDLAIYIGRFSIGTGQFKSFDNFLAEFTGTYAVLFQHGTLAIRIKLADQNPEQTSGACEITLNNKTDIAATYSVDAQKITFKTTLNDTPVDIYKSKNGTQIDHVTGHNIWIGPG